MGGPFWSSSGQVSLIGDERRPPYDFSRPRLRELAKELSPALLRIGGSAADMTFYDLSDTPPAQAPSGYEFVSTKAQWLGVKDFAAATGMELLVTLNVGPGPRHADGSMDVAQARALAEWAKQNGLPVRLWEAGNEVNGFPFVHKPVYSRSGAEYAADYAALRTALKGVETTARLAGPSSAYWPEQGEVNPILADFLAAATDVDVVTWHYYPQQSRRCPVAVRRATPELMLQPAMLDEVRKWASQVEKAAGAKEIWLGESGGAQCGGEPGVSDGFAGTFWWLDQLGNVARRGHRISVRQSLSGASYGLLNEDTLEPRPDYWASVLWKRLMGTRVLDASVSGGSSVRAYAHCARGRAGEAVALVLNLDASETVQLDQGTEAWVVTAEALASQALKLNGEPIALEALEPAPGAPRLPPRSWAFVRLAAVSACD